MVKGLDVFRDHFRFYADHFILIGGAACDLAFQEAGMTFRATKDLDIVLCVEALHTDFVRVFWEFIHAGGYANKNRSTGRKQTYRFSEPQQNGFPVMLELFSRKPDALSLRDGSHLTPLSSEAEISSLSAILLNDEYYEFIHSGKILVDGLSVLGPERLIPLKIHAWLDLSYLKSSGEPVDNRDIKKHRNDALRLAQLLDQDARIFIPTPIQVDIKEFISRMPDENLDSKSLGLRNLSHQRILNTIVIVYGLG